MQIINQQQSPEEGNVQRLSREGVGVSEDIETENTLTDKAEGKDIVQNLRSLSKLKSKEQFLEKAYRKYGNTFTYDLTNYNGLTKNKVGIICAVHGRFEQIPHTFLLANCKTGCKKCGEKMKNQSKTKDYDNLLKSFKKIHAEKYLYPEINRLNYVNRKSKIKIICKEHGEFIKSGQKHLSGQACFECKIKDLIERNILVGGYSEDLFRNKPELKSKRAYLYYISINNGRLYKIGISTKINNRMRGIRSKAKNFIKSMDLLWTCEDTLYNCFKKEQELLEKYKEDRVFLKWSTELFSKDVLPIKLDKLN